MLARQLKNRPPNMNVVKNTGSRQKTTQNDFQIIKPGQYKVPRINKSELPEKKTRKNKSTGLSIDNSTICSRLVSRSDLVVPRGSNTSEVNGSLSVTNLRSECTPSLFATGRTSHNSRLNIPTASHNILMPEYDVKQKVVNIVSSSTLRQLIAKPISTVTGRVIHSDRFKAPMAINHRIFTPKYDPSQNVENHLVNNTSRKFDIKPTSSTSRQLIRSHDLSMGQMITENRNVFTSQSGMSQEVKGFITSTPQQQYVKSVSSASASVILDATQKNSRDPLCIKKHDSNKGDIVNSVIISLTEGRGSAQGEIGLAAIDLKRPILILCQISDSQNYMNTINKINILNPAEILVPDTFLDQIQGTLLYNTIKSQFPLSTILTASRKYFCESKGKHYLKNSIIPECISILEQVLPKFYAISAAAALLKYIEFNHSVVFSSNTLKIEFEGIEKTMFVDANTAMRLELVLNSSTNTKNTLYDVLNHCTTIGGQRRLRSSILQPSYDIQLIFNRQEALEELLSIQKQDFTLLKNVIEKFADVEQLYWLCTKVSQTTQHMSKLQGNYTLLLKNTLETLPTLVDILKPFKSECISSIHKTLSNAGYSNMLTIIEMTINNESIRSKGFSQSQFQRCFAVKSNLNPFLDVGRAVYSELIEELNDKVKVLGEQLETEHLVLKNSSNRGFHVQVEQKNIKNFDVNNPPSICKNVERVKNIIKFTTEDVSIFNVRITQTINSVEILSNEILFEMLQELRKYISCIYDLCNSIADLDLIFSLAQYSMQPGLVRPKFGQCTRIQNSKHPILNFIKSTIPVSNDIYASADQNLNIITGPNMGGKSIYIRQVALLQIIAQIGCFVPATQAQFRLCDRLFTRIGFGDNIESNASTWALEIKEINGIIPSLTKHSLIIIDELCRATSCDEGSSLAWAICEHLMQSCAFIFFATHSILITKLQDLYCNVMNYHMEAIPAIDSTSGLSYTYKLRVGVTDIYDYGIALAKNVKMPENLIEHAIHIGNSLRQTKTPLLNNPTNGADLILDNYIQKLLKIKDDECLDVTGFQTVISELINELEEELNNAIDTDSSMECTDSNTETLNEIVTDVSIFSKNNSASTID